MKRNLSKLTEQDKEFVKDLSRKLVLRSYLVNSVSKPRTLLDKLKGIFIKKFYRAPVVDILDTVEKRRK